MQLDKLLLPVVSSLSLYFVLCLFVFLKRRYVLACLHGCYGHRNHIVSRYHFIQSDLYWFAQLALCIVCVLLDYACGTFGRVFSARHHHS